MIETTSQDFLDLLAARTPTPGGVAAAAHAAAMGTALMTMVVRFSRARTQDADDDAVLADAERSLERPSVLLRGLGERDAAAFGHVVTAYGMPKDTPHARAMRNKAIEEAIVGAMVVPEEMLCLVRDVYLVMNPVLGLVGKHVAADLGAASELLRAAGEAAFLNVRIQTTYLRDQDRARKSVARVLVIRDEILRHHDAIRGVIDGLL